MAASRRGFTLMELMIVVVIIAVLFGLLLAGLSALKKSKDRAVTMNFMSQLGEALNGYLDQFPRLGDHTSDQYSDDFRRDPWKYLGRRQIHDKKQPLVDVPLKQLVTVTGANTCSPATDKYHATHIVDGYGNTPTNVLSWAIVNTPPLGGAAGDYRETKTIDLRSSAGTATDITDDIVYHWENTSRSWTFMKTTVPWNDDTNQHNAPLPGVPTYDPIN